MSTPDDLDDKLADLCRRTEGIDAPSGLEIRVMRRLRSAQRPESFWDVEWWVSLRALPIALCTAAVALALAVWQDGLLTDSLVKSVKAPTDVEIRDP